MRHQLSPSPAPTDLARRYMAERARMPVLAAPLSAEDCQVQSMPDASPVKWHLAHVTWFFETFVLARFEPGHAPFHPAYKMLFNSYYNVVGDKHPRARRGLVTRPGLDEVMAWRKNVDERMATLLVRHGAGEIAPELAALVELGLQHEQQHQELLLTDLKHLLWCNPLQPVYMPRWPLARVAAVPWQWVAQAGGVVQTGHDAAQDPQRFAFDNEAPRHASLLPPYALASRPVTHGEWADFIADGGYADPRWWLAAGFDWVQSQGISAPLYWQRDDERVAGRWQVFTLHGPAPLDSHTPVAHISLFEADAYARWKAANDEQARGARLPTETEWEHAAAPWQTAGLAAGNFVDSGALHPLPVTRAEPGLMQLYGDVWEWTASAYLPYPGYRPWAGAVGEYNGKFMIDQSVLRGGSCASPRSHVRASYRNFFPSAARWQFSGLRLARDSD